MKDFPSFVTGGGAAAPREIGDAERPLRMGFYLAAELPFSGEFHRAIRR